MHLGAQDARSGEVGRLEHDVGGALVDLGVPAAEDAGDHQRALDVGDHEHLVVECAFHAVQRDDPLARRGTADDQPAAADLAGVERVQRLPVGEHDVVGHVDDVVDGPHAGVREARLEPRRGVPDAHAPDHGGAVARAQLRSGDLDRDVLGRRRAAERRRGRDGRRRQVQARRRRDLAGDAVDAEAVRAVRGEFQLEHVLGHRQVALQRVSDDPLAREHRDARALVLVAELLLAHDHAVALDPAQVGLLQSEAALEHGSAERDRDHVPGDEVVCAADDLAHAAVPLPHVDGAQVEPVGVGVLLLGEDPADHEAAQVVRLARGADPVDTLHLGAAHGQDLGHLLDRALPGDVLLDPAERDSHRVRLLRTAAGSGRRCRRTGAGRGCRGAAWPCAPPPCRRRSRSPSRDRSRRSRRAPGRPCRRP